MEGAEGEEAGGCGGSSIYVQHGRQKGLSKSGGSSICEHSRLRIAAEVWRANVNIAGES
jgi:hypothetical protein